MGYAACKPTKWTSNLLMTVGCRMDGRTAHGRSAGDLLPPTSRRLSENQQRNVFGQEEVGQKNQAKSRHDKKAEQQDQPNSGGSALKKQTRWARKQRTIDEQLIQVYDEIPCFRQSWERLHGRYFGSFEDTTVVPPKCYTHKLPVPKDAVPDNTLQIFSIKVAIEAKDVHWPLRVFGLIAVRDSIDPRRNLIFQRERDNCQTITEEDPYLLLTGPYRAPVLIDPAKIEVQLIAKGQTVSEDKDLIFSVLTTWPPCPYSIDPPCMFAHSLCGICSSLEFRLAVLAYSVEATVRIRVIDGSWPERMRGRVSAHTSSIDHGDIVLLDSGDRLVPERYGFIQLSRHVVSVELSGELKVVVEAKSDEDIEQMVSFKPKDSGCSSAALKFLSCTLAVSIAWSKFIPLIPGQPGPAINSTI